MDAAKRKELLKKIASSTPSSGGNNLLDGRGRLVVKKLELADGYEGDRLVAKFVVLSSSKIPVTSQKTGQALDISPNPPLSELGIPYMFKHDAAFGAAKGLVLSLFGETDATDDEFLEALDAVTGPDNMARGRVIDYATYRKITRENKIEIVVPEWSTVEQTDADIEKMQAWLDALSLGVPEGIAATQAKA